MQLMLCIRGTYRTNTVTGKVYENVGRFICPLCGDVSPILEFEEPVTEFDSIKCHACKKTIYQPGRYSHRSRFILLNTPDDNIIQEEVQECTI